MANRSTFREHCRVLSGRMDWDVLHLKALVIYRVIYFCLIYYNLYVFLAVMRLKKS